MPRSHVYCWKLDLRSPPDALWPLIADTNRFNRDTRVPPVLESRESASLPGASPLARPMRLRTLGLTIRWMEEPFEWVEPRRFSLVRRCIGSPVESLRVRMALEPRGSGSRLSYVVEAASRNLLGLAFIRVQIGLLTWRAIAKVFRRYDAEASSSGAVNLGDTLAGTRAPDANDRHTTRDERLRTLRKDLIERGQDRAIVDRLIHLVEHGDDLPLSRLKPYLIADQWGAGRQSVLTLMLHAARTGLLDFRWDLLCPLCRGSKASAGSLGELPTGVHCDACHIDVTANLDRLVELTFRPNPAVRAIDVGVYCIGGPGATPHILAQQLLEAGESRRVSLRLGPGLYRARTKTGLDPEVDRAARLIRVTPTATAGMLVFRAGETAQPESALGPEATIEFVNTADRPRLFMVERLAWAEDAVTAADVFALQAFRDLFSAEALRPGDQVSVGSVTLLFTDLKESTKMYREIGDAPAFGRVMSHFDVLKEVVARHHGAVVKSMGDAIMAVFGRPADAAAAAREMHASLRAGSAASLSASRSFVRSDTSGLRLKTAVHTGPCIAVTLNDRLDYFGSTVNIAARLVGLARGDDIIISDAVRADPQVSAMLDGSAERVEESLRGFGDERFVAWRVRA